MKEAVTEGDSLGEPEVEDVFELVSDTDTVAVTICVFVGSGDCDAEVESVCCDDGDAVLARDREVRGDVEPVLDIEGVTVEEIVRAIVGVPRADTVREGKGEGDVVMEGDVDVFADGE